MKQTAYQKICIHTRRQSNRKEGVCILTEILLSIIANISILMAGYYLLIKVTPSKKDENLTRKQRISLVLISGIIGFILMFFSVNLPNAVKIDLRHIVITISAFYFGPYASVAVSLLVALFRLFWGINNSSILAFILFSTMGLILPIIRKFLNKYFNKYITLLCLSIFCNLLMAVQLAVRFDDVQLIVVGFVSILLVSSFTIIVITMFIDDIQANKSNLFHEQQEAKTDYLTGAYNVREFNRTWNKIRKDRQLDSVTFLLLDIDHFKKINDTYGHSSGDLVLQQITQILKENLQYNQSVYRVGGEEFCMVLPNLTVGEQLQTAERIRSVVEQSDIHIEEQKIIHVTVSLGLAATGKFEEADMQSLYRHADKALYEAKESGRNRVIVYNG